MMTLAENTAQLFAQIEIAGQMEGLEALATKSQRCRAVINRPMRVALVGQTSAGKSTLMNALLGQELAFMATQEMTFNVCWYCYAPQPSLHVHYANGKCQEQDFSNLQKLSVRGSDTAQIENIQYLEVGIPNPLLKSFELIDTPGLYSFYKKDSAHTVELLTGEATRPHALLFLFSDYFKEPDLAELAKFNKASGTLMTGLTAIGVLTKVDFQTFGFQDAERIIKQTLDLPQLQRSLFGIFPTMGKVALAAQTMQNSEFASLQAIAKLPEETLETLLISEEFFLDPLDSPNEALSSQNRQQLVNRFGISALRVALEELQNQPQITAQKLAQKLLSYSRCDTLRRLVLSHFGGRAYLLKVYAGLMQLNDCCRRIALSSQLSSEAHKQLDKVLAAIDNLIINEPRFQEFMLLKQLYEGNLKISEAVTQELLNLTGENGTTMAARLGMPLRSSLEEMIKKVNERLSYWVVQKNLPTFFGRDDRSRIAATMVNSYSSLLPRLSQAIALLNDF